MRIKSWLAHLFYGPCARPGCPRPGSVALTPSGLEARPLWVCPEDAAAARAGHVIVPPR